MSQPAALGNLVHIGQIKPLYIQAQYKPLPDITAFELAQLLPYLVGRHMTEADWDALGDRVTRHLERVTP